MYKNLNFTYNLFLRYDADQSVLEKITNDIILKGKGIS